MTKRPHSYLVLDISLREKFMGLAYSGAAGGLAAVAGREVVALGIKSLSLAALFPEFTATLVGVIAFAHTADAAGEKWARSVPADQLRMRAMAPPKIQI